MVGSKNNADCKQYWTGRKITTSKIRELLIRLKRNGGIIRLLSFFYSTKMANEHFVRSALNHGYIKNVLDIACGSGKHAVAAKYAIGIDITGYPEDMARAKGYKELYCYCPPEYKIELKMKVDAIVLINLNAHICWDTFATILKNALPYLNKRGRVIIVNEYNNNGITYRLFRRRPLKYSRLVNGMYHFHLEYENKFMDKILNTFQALKLNKRKPLIGGVVPFIQYYGYLFEKTPYKLLWYLSMLFDIPLSMINNIQTALFPLYNKSFLVGYTFEKTDRLMQSWMNKII